MTVTSAPKVLDRIDNLHLVALVEAGAQPEPTETPTYLRVRDVFYSLDGQERRFRSSGAVAYDLGPLPRTRAGWLQRLRQPYDHAILAYLIQDNQYYGYGIYSKTAMREEIQLRVNGFFGRRRFEVAMARLVGAGLVFETAHPYYTRRDNVYEISYAGIIQAARLGLY